MAITDELLKGLAAQVANMAKTELRHRRKLSGILATYHEGEGLHRMRKIEQLAIERAGEAWLNSDAAKDIVFGVLVAFLPHPLIAPDALAIATVMDFARTTKEFSSLPEAERARLLDLRPAAIAANEAYSKYFETGEQLVSLVQSTERVCMHQQILRGSLFIGEPTVECFPQADFKGRLKMYGVDPPPALKSAADDLWRKRQQ